MYRTEMYTENKNYSLTDGVGVDDLVLGVDVDLAALVLPRLDGQQQQVELRVADLRDLK